MGFTNITFDTNGATDGNWTHGVGADFMATETGTYEIDYNMYYERTSASFIAGTTVEVRASLNGTEIAGSQAEILYFRTGNFRNRQCISRSIIVNITAGEVLRFQHRSSATGSSMTATGTAILPTSATVTIVKIK